VTAGERYADWLPPRDGGEQPWTAHGAAVLERRFQVLAVVTVLAILVAVACLCTGQVVAMILGPALAATGGYAGFAAERRLRGLARRDRHPRPGGHARHGGNRRRDLRGRQPDRAPAPAAGPAVKALSELPGLPAIIAGHGPAMTVLVLPNPRLRERPMLTYRWRP
jgi:hypothetical protein